MSTYKQRSTTNGDRKQWIAEAQKHCTEFSSNQLGKLYDALKSGELKVPE